MPRVLIVAGDATESLDTWYPYHRLREEGIEVHIGAPSKRVLNSVIHDFEPGCDTCVEKPGYRIPADIAFADVEPEEYDARHPERRPRPGISPKRSAVAEDRPAFCGTQEAHRRPLPRLAHPRCRRCRPWPYRPHLRSPGPGHRTRRGTFKN